MKLYLVTYPHERGMVVPSSSKESARYWDNCRNCDRPMNPPICELTPIAAANTWRDGHYAGYRLDRECQCGLDDPHGAQPCKRELTPSSPIIETPRGNWVVVHPACVAKLEDS